MKSNGCVEKVVVGSIVKAIPEKRYGRTYKNIHISLFTMVSFTITEKGYSLYNVKGDYLPKTADDLKNLLEKPKSTMELVAMLCYKRYLAGKSPLALVSMDNCSHNGTKLYNAIRTFVDN